VILASPQHSQPISFLLDNYFLGNGTSSFLALFIIWTVKHDSLHELSLNGYQQKILTVDGHGVGFDVSQYPTFNPSLFERTIVGASP
jgi:hypothetical protein